MRAKHWALVYGCMAVATVIGVGVRWSGAAPHAGDPARFEPPAAKVAVCDIYKIADKLIASDRFKPQIETEGERIRKELEPMEAELKGMQEKLQNASPQDADAQKMMGDFNTKRQVYMQARQRLEAEGQAFIAKQYVAAYDLVKGSVESVSKELGFTHVIASRGKDEKIETDNPQRVIDAVLARPVLVAPEGSDITEDVIKDLKLT